MNSKLTLSEAIDCVFDTMRKSAFSKRALEVPERVFKRLMNHANAINEIYLSDELVSLFLSDFKNHNTGSPSYSRFLENVRYIKVLQTYIKSGEVITKRHRTYEEYDLPKEFQDCLSVYDNSEEALGLSSSSLVKNRRPIKYLLKYMSNNLGYTKISDIQKGDTIKAIGHLLANHYSPSSLATAISGMRRFYKMFPGLIQLQLEIPRGIKRKRTIIDVFSEDEKNAIISCLSSTKISYLKSAVGFLSFETGLRGIDICNLKLSDVDWKQNTITIVQSKTKKPLTLPLRSTYGNSMVKYLLEERPQSDEDYFFLTKSAPHKRLCGINGIIRDIVFNSGVDPQGRPIGPQMFRHNAASSMLKKGVPISTISAGLGHSSSNSTMVYLSTDNETLATLTLPFPKGVI